MDWLNLDDLGEWIRFLLMNQKIITTKFLIMFTISHLKWIILTLIAPWKLSLSIWGSFHLHIIISAGFRIWLHGDVNWENRSNLYPGELESRIFVNIENFGAIVFCERKFCECKFCECKFCECKFCECKFWKCKFKSLRKKSNTFYTIFRNMCTSNYLNYTYKCVKLAKLS